MEKNNLENVRVRIAPSPTGALHIGTVRTAFFNFLFAKKYKGVFILRIEDTDKERSKKEWQEDISQGLDWLAISPDESPDRPGDFGPYCQSERGAIYRQYIEKLLKEDKIYRCFCKTEDLKAQRDYLLSIGKPAKYEGHCRELSQEKIEENLAQNKPFVFRLKTPAEKVVFEDLIRGEIAQDSAVFGDMVVAKSIDEPLYNLACVIDDYQMKISHVIRGEDHIANTPKQILIALALEIAPPQYIHLPMILGPDRTKLSKRHSATSLLSYKDDGYLPKAVLNFLAFLSWSPADEREIFSLDELIKEFSINGLQKSAAIFNIAKLDWFNGFYIRQSSLDEISQLCLPYFIKAGLLEPLWGQNEVLPQMYQGASIDVIKYRVGETGQIISFEKIKEIVFLYKERLKKLSEISQLADDFFRKKLDYPSQLLKWKTMESREVVDVLDKLTKLLSKIKEGDWQKEKISEILLIEAEKMKDRGKLLWPLRVALTGKQASAGPFEVAEVLGKERCLERLKQAKKSIKL